MKVKGNHPLAEVIAKKLFGIEGVPKECMQRMVNAACKSAVEYHTKKLEEAKPKVDVEKIDKIIIDNSFKQEVGCPGMFVRFVNEEDRKKIAEAIATSDIYTKEKS